MGNHVCYIVWTCILTVDLTSCKCLGRKTSNVGTWSPILRTGVQMSEFWFGRIFYCLCDRKCEKFLFKMWNYFTLLIYLFFIIFLHSKAKYLRKSRAHHNKGSHLGNTRSRHLETASARCRSIMLFISVQSLKREPALLNAHQVLFAICSCMALKKPRVSKRKSSQTGIPGRSHSHPKPVPCKPVLYNIIKSGF